MNLKKGWFFRANPTEAIHPKHHVLLIDFDLRYFFSTGFKVIFLLNLSYMYSWLICATLIASFYLNAPKRTQTWCQIGFVIFRILNLIFSRPLAIKWQLFEKWGVGRRHALLIQYSKLFILSSVNFQPIYLDEHMHIMNIPQHITV